MILILLLTLAGEPRPMNVMINDKVINLSIVDPAGNSTHLSQVIKDGFIFILSPECRACQSAVNTINTQFKGNPSLVLVVGEEPIPGLNDLQAEYFNVSMAALLPFEITTFPACLVYTNGKLAAAFHGNIERNASMLIKAYQKKKTVP